MNGSAKLAILCTVGVVGAGILGCCIYFDKKRRSHLEYKKNGLLKSVKEDHQDKKYDQDKGDNQDKGGHRKRDETGDDIDPGIAIIYAPDINIHNLLRHANFSVPGLTAGANAAASASNFKIFVDAIITKHCNDPEVLVKNIDGSRLDGFYHKLTSCEYTKAEREIMQNFNHISPTILASPGTLSAGTYVKVEGTGRGGVEHLPIPLPPFLT